jgi:hypothetical protein
MNGSPGAVRLMILHQDCLSKQGEVFIVPVKSLNLERSLPYITLRPDLAKDRTVISRYHDNPVQNGNMNKIIYSYEEKNIRLIKGFGK